MQAAHDVSCERVVSVTGYKPEAIAVCKGAMGHCRQWERLFSCIDRLTPALSRAYPGQLVVDPAHQLPLRVRGARSKTEKLM